MVANLHPPKRGPLCLCRFRPSACEDLRAIRLSRGDARLFATVDLGSPLATGVTLAVGIRNSFDKSLPLGFVAGNRVFVCDNLAFRSDLSVKRKHTRFG